MCYKFLMWGFIFLVNIQIGGFDILPDIIGYYFIIQGLHMLRNNNKHFYKARNATLLIVIAYAVAIGTFIYSGDYMRLNDGLPRFLWADKIALVLMFPILKSIYKGTAKECSLIGDHESENLMIKARKWIELFWLVVMFCGIFSVAIRWQGTLALIVFIVTAILMFKCEKSLQQTITN